MRPQRLQTLAGTVRCSRGAMRCRLELEHRRSATASASAVSNATPLYRMLNVAAYDHVTIKVAGRHTPVPCVGGEAGLAVVVEAVRVGLVAIKVCGLLEYIAAPALLARHRGLLRKHRPGVGLCLVLQRQKILCLPAVQVALGI